VKENDYIYPERLVTTHCLIYLFGMGVILVLGILLNLFKGPIGSIYGLFCCMTKIEGQIFSNDIYEEMNITDIKREYVKTKNELQDYQSLIGNNQKSLFIEDSAWSRHTTAALKAKLEYIKLYQNHFLNQTKKPVRKDTLENFDELFKEFKNKNTHRLSSLYSYDIKDNTDYIKCQKIEEKIRSDFQKK